MGAHDHEGAAACANGEEPAVGRAIFLRHATRRRGFLTASLIGGLLVGVAYRALLDIDPPDWANYVRSGLHGVGIGLTVWAVQVGFASGARSRPGAALRRLPLAGEVVVRAIVMTAALIVVGMSLQFLLYAEPYQLHWLTRTGRRSICFGSSRSDLRFPWSSERCTKPGG
jgi:ABC-type uncharacterized transport system permease subunit